MEFECAVGGEARRTVGASPASRNRKQARKAPGGIAPDAQQIV